MSSKSADDGADRHAYAWQALTDWFGDNAAPPSPAEWQDFIAFLRETRGDHSAFSIVDRILPHVLRKWGPEAAAAATGALRSARCVAQGPTQAWPRSDWDRAAVAIARLPAEWQGPFRNCMERSRDAAGLPVAPSGVVLSAATIRNVAYVLTTWHDWCHTSGRSIAPSALGFEAWAIDMQENGRAPRSVAGALREALIGLRLVLPEAEYRGAEWVAADWSDAARLVPPLTKSAAGVIPATEIFALSRRLLAQADAQPLRSVTSTIDYRNAFLLMLAACLPQRARAMSRLDSASTFRLLERPFIRVDLPGHVLKRRETRKRRLGYHATIDNPILWEAYDKYLRHHRPLMDNGTHLWPSARRYGKSLDPQRLSEIFGELTEKHLGTHVSMHRVRDAVATEACEHMPNGGQIAPKLLGHVDSRVTDRHYDHSTGVAAARMLAAALPKSSRRRPLLGE